MRSKPALAAAIAIAILGCSSEKTASTQSSSSRPVEGWRRYASAEGGYSVTMPSAPRETTRKSGESPVVGHVATAATASYIYEVTWFDIPGGDATMSSMIDAQLSYLQTTFKAQDSTDASLGGKPAKSVHFEKDGMTHVARIAGVGDRMYIAEVGGAAAKDADSFFDSFELAKAR